MERLPIDNWNLKSSHFFRPKGFRRQDIRWSVSSMFPRRSSSSKTENCLRCNFDHKSFQFSQFRAAIGWPGRHWVFANSTNLCWDWGRPAIISSCQYNWDLQTITLCSDIMICKLDYILILTSLQPSRAWQSIFYQWDNIKY